MTDLVALRRLGATTPLKRELGHYPRAPVARTRELDRILAIPRHLGYSNTERTAIERSLLRPGGTMHLWPAQANALLAALDTATGQNATKLAGGLFAPLAVGEGKTLVAALLPSVLASKRPVIFTTAALEKQMRRMIAIYSEHFRIVPDLPILSYALLSRPESSDLLARLNPDLFIGDEAHALRNASSARTKRFYRLAKAHPECMFCFLSGTLTKRSILDQAPLLELALRDWAPIPRDYPTCKEWSEALDPNAIRPAGALMLLPGDPEDDARTRFARRLRETRGVVSSAPTALGASLRIDVVDPPKSQLIDEARRSLVQTWARPDGEEMTTAIEIAEVDRQLRMGGCYLWTTQPAREWLYARREYFRAVRHWLSTHSRENCDSPALVERAARNGELSLPELKAWDVVAHLPIPPRIWRWIDESRVMWIAERLTTPTVVFSDIVAVGRRIAEVAHVPYYGEGPSAASGILEEKGDRSIVASIDAHGQGRNLQMFSHAILIGVPPAGDTMEQVLGRLHRPGQEADEVVYEVLTIHEAELHKAHEEATFLNETTQQMQKLTLASIDWSS